MVTRTILPPGQSIKLVVRFSYMDHGTPKCSTVLKNQPNRGHAYHPQGPKATKEQGGDRKRFSKVLLLQVVDYWLVASRHGNKSGTGRWPQGRGDDTGPPPQNGLISNSVASGRSEYCNSLSYVVF